MRTVVVGHGMAGARFAAELHSRSQAAKITVLGAEPHRPYNRILLSNLLAGKVGESDVELVDVAGHGLDVRPGVTAVGIDPDARTVATTAGDVIEYDHLVLATGSRAFVPPLPGLENGVENGVAGDRVAVFRTLADCRRIVATAERSRRAIVLGGGLLGLEAARGLAARGLDVLVVHAVGHLMERQLDPAAGRVLARTLTGLGIATRLGVPAASVQLGAETVTVTLVDGEVLTADLLVLACGVVPETTLARDAGLTVERGIVVNDRLGTSDPHIGAIGDCAQHGGVVTGLVAPAWEQARVLARVLAGDDAHYRPLRTVTRLKAAGIDLAAMGDPPGPGREVEESEVAEELCFSDPSRGTYAWLRIVDERVTGAIMLGDNPAVGTVIQLFDRGAPVPLDRRGLLLGRAPAAVAAASPALMPDATTVCQCNAVTKGALVAGWRAGATGRADLVAATRATTGCGGCGDAVDGIVAWLSTVEPREAS